MLGCWLLALSARAQGWSALAISNYGGTHTASTNPSALADSPYRWYVNVGAADWSLYNNFAELRGPYSLWNLVSGDVPSAKLNSGFNGFFSDACFVTAFDGKPKYANFAGELRLPAVAFAWKGRSVAFSNRVRAFMQLNGVSDGLARLARSGPEGLDSAQITRMLSEDQQFTLNMSAWHEFAGTYAWTLTPPGARHFWKVGVTGKYLVGLGAMYLRSENAPLPLDPKTPIPVPIYTQRLSYVYTDFNYYRRPDFRLRDLYTRDGRMGRGAGLDVGFTYEFRSSPEWSTDGDAARLAKYRWRVGVAVTDLGSIHYQKPRAMRGLLLKPIVSPNTQHLDSIRWHGFPAVDGLTSQVFGVDEALYSIDAALPTTLHLTVDRAVLPNLFVSLLWQQSLLKRRTVGARTFSGATLAARFEHRQFEVALPLRLGNDYHTLRPGLMLRVGPAFFGSDDLGGFLADRELRGFDMYFGAAFVVAQPAPGKPRRHFRAPPAARAAESGGGSGVAVPLE